MSSEQDEFIGLNDLCNMNCVLAENCNNHKKKKLWLETALEMNSNSTFALHLLALYYECKANKLEVAEKYYLDALELDPKDTDILYNLADFYKKIKNNTLMVKYYEILIHEHKSIEAATIMAEYSIENNYEYNFLKYYLIALELSDEEPLFDLKIDQFRLLNILEKVDNPTEKVKNMIKELQNVPDIVIFNNKVRLFTKLNNVCECNICYETKLNIDLHCGHELCVDCYKSVYKNDCPWCRTTSYFASDIETDDDEYDQVD